MSSTTRSCQPSGEIVAPEGGKQHIAGAAGGGDRLVPGAFAMFGPPGNGRCAADRRSAPRPLLPSDRLAGFTLSLFDDLAAPSTGCGRSSTPCGHHVADRGDSPERSPAEHHEQLVASVGERRGPRSDRVGFPHGCQASRDDSSTHPTTARAARRDRGWSSWSWRGDGWQR